MCSLSSEHARSGRLDAYQSEHTEWIRLRLLQRPSPSVQIFTISPTTSRGLPLRTRDRLFALINVCWPAEIFLPARRNLHPRSKSSKLTPCHSWWSSRSVTPLSFWMSRESAAFPLAGRVNTPRRKLTSPV